MNVVVHQYHYHVQQPKTDDPPKVPPIQHREATHKTVTFISNGLGESLAVLFAMMLFLPVAAIFYVATAMIVQPPQQPTIVIPNQR